MSNDILIIVLLIILALLALVFVPQWRLKRAIPQVIRIFRYYNAAGIKNAKTLEELGLQPRGLLDSLLKGRDYKQYALTALMRMGIIMVNEGKLYLSEEKLMSSGLEKRR